MDQESTNSTLPTKTTTPRRGSRRKKSKTPKPPPQPTADDSQEPDFWEIRGVLDEKIIKGKRYYLCDWADNKKTGETYPPSWEPEVNLTIAALQHWQSRDRQTGTRHKKRPSSSADSDPIHSTKRRKLDLRDRSESRRQNETPDTPRHQAAPSAGQASVSSSHEVLSSRGSETPSSIVSSARNQAKRPKEIKDSQEDSSIQTLQLHSLNSQHETPLQPTFDSAQSQQSGDYQPDFSANTGASQQSGEGDTSAARNGKKAFIWDEDSSLIVQDSQELPGSSSYRLAETQSSQPPTNTASTDAQTTSQFLDISSSIEELNRNRSELSEPPASSSYNSYPGDGFEPIVARRSAEPLSSIPSSSLNFVQQARKHPSGFKLVQTEASHLGRVTGETQTNVEPILSSQAIADSSVITPSVFNQSSHEDAPQEQNLDTTFSVFHEDYEENDNIIEISAESRLESRTLSGEDPLPVPLELPQDIATVEEKSPPVSSEIDQVLPYLNSQDTPSPWSQGAARPNILQDPSQTRASAKNIGVESLSVISACSHLKGDHRSSPLLSGSAREVQLSQLPSQPTSENRHSDSEVIPPPAHTISPVVLPSSEVLQVEIIAPDSSLFLYPKCNSGDDLQNRLPSVEQSNSIDICKPSPPSSSLPELQSSYGSNLPSRPSPGRVLQPPAMEGTPTMSVREQILAKRAKHQADILASISKKSGSTTNPPGLSSARSEEFSSPGPSIGSADLQPLPSPQLTTPVQESEIILGSPVGNIRSIDTPSVTAPITLVNQHHHDSKTIHTPLASVSSPSQLPIGSDPINTQAKLLSPSPVPQTSPKADRPPVENDSISETSELAGRTPSPDKLVESQIIGLGPREYVIPLPMPSVVRGVSEAMIQTSQRQVKRFLRQNEVDLRLYEGMRTLIERVKLCCESPLLLEDEKSSQDQMSDEWIAKYAENCSTKCVLLSSLLDTLRFVAIRVAIFVRPGRMAEILAAYCRYHKFNYRHLNKVSAAKPMPESDGLSVTLIPTDFVIDTLSASSYGFFIAYDSTFSREKLPVNYQGALAAQQPPILLHLVINHSVEHFEMCIPKRVVGLDRTSMLLEAVMTSQGKMGCLPDVYLGPDQAGQEVAKYIVAAGGMNWPLLPTPYIEDIAFSSETLAEAAEPSSSTQSQNGVLHDSNRTGAKRSLTIDDENENTKRAKVNGQQTSVFMDSQMIDSSSEKSSAQSSKTIKKLVRNEDSVIVKLPDSERIRQLEEELHKSGIRESELLKSNQKLEARCVDYDISMAAIQPKYQDALNERAKAARELQALATQHKVLEEREQRLVEEVRSLKESQVVATEKLHAAEKQLASSSIPEIAEAQKLKDELSASYEKISSLEKKIESEQNDHAYTKNAYQEASAAAGAANSELATLQKEFDKVRSKASENLLIIHKMQLASEEKEHVKRIDELVGENAQLDDLLQRATEQLSVLNARRPTRGGSVPKSPRLSTMSPRGNIRSMVGSISRGPSPAPGDSAGPGSRFSGEALMFSGRSTPRQQFGEHLNE